jgi:hypothetical protein
MIISNLVYKLKGGLNLYQGLIFVNSLHLNTILNIKSSELMYTIKRKI